MKLGLKRKPLFIQGLRVFDCGVAVTSKGGL